MIDLRNIFAWFYRRYQMGYAFAGSIIAIVNFVGIFTILLQDITGLSKFMLIPMLVAGGFVGFIVLSIILFDILKLQTYFMEKDGQMHDYWDKKLTPIQQKQLMITLEAIENKDNIKDIKDKIMSGYL